MPKTYLIICDKPGKMLACQDENASVILVYGVIDCSLAKFTNDWDVWQPDSQHMVTIYRTQW